MAHALRHEERDQQLALYGRAARIARAAAPASKAPLCAGCRAREARYGFRDEAEPLAHRPRTLCFDCFRMEIKFISGRAASPRRRVKPRTPVGHRLERLA